jgi:hypothetical protein
VTDDAIRKWCQKFGQAYAHQLRRRRPQRGETWHLDEVFTVGSARPESAVAGHLGSSPGARAFLCMCPGPLGDGAAPRAPSRLTTCPPGAAVAQAPPAPGHEDLRGRVRPHGGRR